MRILIRLVVSTIAVLVADLLLSGVHAENWFAGLTVAVVLGLLNTFLRPILIILTLPVTLISLGLFILVINAGMVLLADKLVPGFEVQSFWWALGFSLLQWAVQGMLLSFDRPEEKQQ